MRGLRNRIVHDYEGVNLNLIWEIIDLNLGTLREQLLKLGD
ncbi:MAG TPA: HepT-like ribonuclease domain-containing protein [Clostridia bacterium]|nr:HepT-like ribonuclease domain-containing protein [Clostridia bacterium]